MASKLNIYIVVLTAIIFFSSCGYRFSGAGRLPSNIKTVHIAMFENRTSEIGIEHIFTNDLIFEFTRNNSPPVTKEKADAVLKGIINSMQVKTISRRGHLASLERRITAKVALKLVDKNGKIIWINSEISEDETYGVLSEKVATDYGKQTAIRTISKRLAEEIYNQITDEF